MALSHIHSSYVYVCAVVYPNLLYLNLLFSFIHLKTAHPHPRPPALDIPLDYQHFDTTPLPLTPHWYITFRGTFNYHISSTIFFRLSSCLLPLLLLHILFPLSLPSSSPVAVAHPTYNLLLAFLLCFVSFYPLARLSAHTWKGKVAQFY